MHTKPGGQSPLVAHGVFIPLPVLEALLEVELETAVLDPEAPAPEVELETLGPAPPCPEPPPEVPEDLDEPQ